MGDEIFVAAKQKRERRVQLVALQCTHASAPVHSSTHLIRCVTDADVEEGQRHFTKVAQDNVQLLPLASPDDPLVQLGRHPRVHFHHGTLLALLQDPHRQVSRSWTDLEHDVRRFQAGFVDDVLGYKRVLEDMLAEAVGVEDGVTGVACG